MTPGLVVAILISGFFTGAVARLAVPGPDPMPLWLTTAIGLAGSIAGAVVARALGGGGYAVSFTSLGLAIGLVVAYRRLVQHRPVFGPGALEFPKTGLGVDQYRERLQKVGIDPDRLNPAAQLDAAARPGEQARHRAMLEELHRAGILSDDELQEKLQVLRERQA
jgi:uncharacterized membrane protein YeaQ/YmgE (transglycosylase-associated protein family)